MSLKKMEKIHLVRFSSLLMSLYLVLVFSLVSVSIADAQDLDECIDGTKIPAYYQPYIGPITTQFEISPGCILKYTYCYRCDCPQNGCESGMVYYDCYISKISYTGTCSLSYLSHGELGENATFQDVYNYLYDYCLADIVDGVNPWVECDLYEMGVNIPPCEEGISPVLYRAGRPSCMSDFYKIWKPDPNGEAQLWEETAPCNARELPYYCFNTYKYCWEIHPVTNGKYLNRILISSGSPSTYYCPSDYHTQGGNPEIVNCNSVCAE